MQTQELQNLIRSKNFDEGLTQTFLSFSRNTKDDFIEDLLNFIKESEVESESPVDEIEKLESQVEKLQLEVKRLTKKNEEFENTLTIIRNVSTEQLK